MSNLKKVGGVFYGSLRYLFDDIYKENQYLEKTKWYCKGKGFVYLN
jgi:hypothetical protein